MKDCLPGIFKFENYSNKNTIMQINQSGRPLPSLMGYLAQVTPVARSTIEMSRELTASLCLILHFRLGHVPLALHCQKHHRLGSQLHSVRQGIVTFSLFNR